MLENYNQQSGESAFKENKRRLFFILDSNELHMTSYKFFFYFFAVSEDVVNIYPLLVCLHIQKFE